MIGSIGLFKKASHLETGQQGEKLAADFLVSLGYIILEKNYSNRLGEIDIIAREAGVTVFVEVKTRSTVTYGSAFEAVDHRKQRRLVAVANEYLQRHNLLETAARFDVIAITPAAAQGQRIEHIKNAIECMDL